MTSISGITVRQTTYDSIIKKIFTRIDRRPTRRMKDNLLTEVKKVCVGVCVSGFDWASRYGLIAEIIGGAEYEVLTGLAYTEPPKEDPRENCFAKGSDRREYVNFMTACFTRFGACEAICDNIREALPEQCYEQLEDKLCGVQRGNNHGLLQSLG